MVEQAQADPRRAANVEPVKRRAGLRKAKPMEDAVQDTDVAIGSDQRDWLPCAVDGADRIALRAKSL